MKWPADRKFTDKDGKILDHWRGPMGVLEPLLNMSPEQFGALQEIIKAYLAADEGEGGEGANPFELPIEDSPLFSEDYSVGWKTSENAARRFPLGAFRSSIISTTPLAGKSSVSITIPDTYTHVRLVILDASFSTTALARMSLSEDGGSNLLPAAYEIFNHTSIVAASTGNTTPDINPSGGAAAVYSFMIDIFNVIGSVNKLVTLDAVLNSSGSAFTGNYIFTSVAPVNFAQLVASAGTFDAGTVELWGVP